MDRFVVPSDVEAALAGAGFHPVEVAGAGWLAVAVDDPDRRLELHVVPVAADAGTSERAARLLAVRHDHLPVVHDVIELSSGRLGLVVEHVDGLSLAQLRAARAPLGDGEAATVAIPVAGALAALRDAGLAHGSVSESTIVVRPDGRPAVTDLRGALTGADDIEGDLRRLVATVLDQMPGADVHLLSDQADEGSLRGAFAGLLGVPGLDADQVVDACYAATDPEPVRLPDAGARASSALTAMAREVGPQVSARRQERQRRRRRAARVGTGVGVAVLVLVAGIVGRGLVGGAKAPDPVADDPVQAAVELSRARAGIIGTGDVSQLETVDVAGGPASVADAQLLAGLDGDRVHGLAVDVQDAWLVEEDGSRGGTTDVAVTSVMSAYSRIPAAGGTPVPVPASEARTVVLGLRWTDEGWRVWDVVEP